MDGEGEVMGDGDEERLQPVVERYTVTRTTGYTLRLLDGESLEEAINRMLQAGQIESARFGPFGSREVWVRTRFDSDFVPVVAAMRDVAQAHDTGRDA